MGNKLHQTKHHKRIYNEMSSRGYNLKEISADDYIGGGVSFDAYLLNNNVVVKISNGGYTSDSEYANLMQHIDKVVDNDFKHVAQIYNTFSDPKQNLYVITQEYVPLTTNYNYLFNDEPLETDVLYYLTDAHLSGSYSLPEKLDRFIYNLVNRGVIQDVHPMDDIPQETFDEIYDFLSQVVEGIKELQSLGINPRDIHAENVRITKDGTYKIIDF